MTLHAVAPTPWELIANGNTAVGLIAAVLGLLGLFFGKDFLQGVVRRLAQGIRILMFPFSAEARTQAAGMAESLSRLSKAMEHVSAELKPNGGLSLKDAIDRMDQRMARSEVQASFSLDQSMIPTTESDPEGSVIFANLAYIRFTGRELEDIRGRGWVNCLHPDDRQRVSLAFALARADGRLFEERYRHVHADTGAVTYVKGLARPMRDTQGRIIGWMGHLEVEYGPALAN